MVLRDGEETYMHDVHSEVGKYISKDLIPNSLEHFLMDVGDCCDDKGCTDKNCK